MTEALAYTQPLPGAIARGVSDKLSDVVHVKDFGAQCDGVTDDTTAVQTAINSGAQYVRLSGTIKVTSTIVLHAEQTLYLGTGTVLKWGGATGGDVLATPYATVTGRTALICEGGVIDLNGAATGLRLYSTQYSLFDLEFIDSASSTTSQVIIVGSDSTSSTGSITGSRNTLNNVFRRLYHQGSCAALLTLQGSATIPSYVTLNTFGEIRVEQAVYSVGIYLHTQCDSNYFEGPVVFALNAASGVKGVLLNDDATVYNCTFNQVTITYNGTSSNRAGMYFGSQTRWNTVNALYVEPQNAAEVQATAVVDNGAISFNCQLTQTLSSSIQGSVIYGKGTQMRSANFTNGGLTPINNGGLAVFTDVPVDGFILVACSDNSATAAMAYIRPTSSPNATLLAGNATYVAVGTGALSPGGGVAGKINYNAGTDGKLYVANNIGTGINLSIVCLAGKYT